MRLLLLFPAYIYGLIVNIRNKMYDIGLLKSRRFDIPTLCIGNLRVGGTGKTPMAHFVLSKLKDNYNIAILSRGYKRKSKGFVLANENSTCATIGDEPRLLQLLHPDIMVAVCEDRCLGVETICKLNPEINLIVLDDAFQHRAIKPSVNILLTEQDCLYIDDYMLPYGHLRDSKSRASKADIIAVTKCRANISSIDMRITLEELSLNVRQNVVFTNVKSRKPKPLSGESTIPLESPIYVTTAIAKPNKFIKTLEGNFEIKDTFIFNDHHAYSIKDLETILKQSQNLPVVCTAKDAVKILELGLNENDLGRIFVVNIETAIVPYRYALSEESFIRLLRKRIDTYNEVHSEIFRP